jgi:hypothetical protein
MELKLERISFSAAQAKLANGPEAVEIKVVTPELSMRLQPPFGMVAHDVEVSFVITESIINKGIASHPTPGVRDLEIACLSGQLRISGKKEMLLGVGIPFTFTAVPEIEAGARIRLNPRGMTAFGAQAPAAAFQIVADKINEQLVRAFDISRLPVTGRLAEIRVEPGRVSIRAFVDIEIRAATGEMVKREA